MDASQGIQESWKSTAVYVPGATDLMSGIEKNLKKEHVIPDRLQLLPLYYRFSLCRNDLHRQVLSGKFICNTFIWGTLQGNRCMTCSAHLRSKFPGVRQFSVWLLLHLHPSLNTVWSLWPCSHQNTLK